MLSGSLRQSLPAVVSFEIRQILSKILPSPASFVVQITPAAATLEAYKTQRATYFPIYTEAANKTRHYQETLTANLNPPSKTPNPNRATASPTYNSQLYSTVAALVLTSTALPYPESWVNEYYRSNAGCTLPCWWGVSPGATTVQEFLYLLSPFENQFIFEDTPISRDTDEGVKGYVLYFPPLTGSGLDYWLSTFIRVKDDVIIELNIDPEAMRFGGYGILRMFNDFGIPDRVLFKDPFLSLVYHDILASYIVSDQAVRGSYCEYSNAGLVLWAEGYDWSDDQIAAFLSFDEMLPLSPRGNESIYDQVISSGKPCFVLSTDSINK